jgi:nucleoid-associated protein YgaU
VSLFSCSSNQKFEDLPAQENEELERYTQALGSYKVQPGDYLMLIGFKIYGDYKKWRSLLELNNLAPHSKLTIGSIIKYKYPKDIFRWRFTGEPYKVKENDTLSEISEKELGTIKNLSKLIEHNQKLLPGEALIYEGMTLFIPSLSI